MAEETAQRLKESAEQTRSAAKDTAAAAEKARDSAERRTELAAERTYAAWVRTGLVALASGIGAKTLLETVVPGWMVVGTGTVLILFSAFCFVAGVWRQLFVGAPPPNPDVPRLPPAILVVVNGFLAIVALAALLGLWFGRSGH